MRSSVKIDIYNFKFLFFLICISSFAQKSKEEKVDNQIAVAENFYRDFQMKELYNISKDICEHSEKNKYGKGLVYGHFYTACYYLFMNKNKESIQHLYKSQNYIDYLKTDPMQASRNYGLLGSNYLSVGLHLQSAENLKKAIEIVNKVKVKDQRLLYNESIYYGRLSILYEQIAKRDSMYYCLNKEKAIHKLLDDNIYYVQKSSSLIRLGNYFFFQKKSDSASYYYKQALSVLEKKNHHLNVDALIGSGNFYSEKQKYKEPKEYSIQAIDNNKKILQRESVANEFTKIEKEDKTQKSYNKFIKVVSVLCGIIILTSIGLFFFIKHKSKELIDNQETLIDKQETLIHQKQNIIQDKEEENHNLKQKVNESFDEVVQLAKDNSIEFFTRFKEVYPEVISSLLKINPKFRVTELTLCAYFFLGFTSKDVALYTFKSVKTVRNRRQNLRTKLKIPADESLELWFKSLKNHH